LLDVIHFQLFSPKEKLYALVFPQKSHQGELVSRFLILNTAKQEHAVTVAVPYLFSTGGKFSKSMLSIANKLN
jgi:hypothetical protein